MRIYLSIHRNELPSTSILWTVDGPGSSSAALPYRCGTISELLEQVNDVVPLDSKGWGLEDYVVEIDGFECLHFYEIKSVLRDGDEVHIRPLSTADLRARTLSGRRQISSAGRHLLDGVPFGRTFFRRAIDRPPVTIPRRPPSILPDINEDDEALDSAIGRELVTHAEFDDFDANGEEDDEDDEDDDFDPFSDSEEDDQDEDDDIDEPQRQENVGKAVEGPNLKPGAKRSRRDTDAQSTAMGTTGNNDGLDDAPSSKRRRTDHSRKHSTNMILADGRRVVLMDKKGLPILRENQYALSDPSRTNPASNPLETKPRANASSSERSGSGHIRNIRFSGQAGGDAKNTNSTLESVAREEESDFDDDIPDEDTSSVSGSDVTSDSSDESTTSSEDSSSSEEDSSESESEDEPKHTSAKPTSSKKATREPRPAPKTVEAKLKDSRPAPPGQGKATTQRRNVRRRERNRLEHLKRIGELPPAATLQDYRDYCLSQASSSPKTTGAAEKKRAEAKKSSIENFEAKRQELLASIDSGGFDIAQSGLSSSTPVNVPITTTSAELQVININTAEEVAQENGSSLTSKPGKQRGRLDVESSRRILFGALGLKTPKSKSDEDSLRNKLDKQGKRPAPPRTEYVASASATKESGQDSINWRNRIILSAVECCDEGLELSEPPFPFEQRWDPQQQYWKSQNRSSKLAKRAKRRKKINSAVADDEQHDRRAKELQPVNHDAQEYTEDPNTGVSAGATGLHEDPADDVSGAPNGVSIDDLLAKLDNFSRNEDPSDLPHIPADPKARLPVTLTDLKPGLILAFKRLEMTADWQPRISDYRTAIVDYVFENGTVQLTLAKRDRIQKEKHFDAETGERVYGKFDMPSDEEEEDEEEEDGLLELPFSELQDPIVVKAPQPQKPEEDQKTDEPGLMKPSQVLKASGHEVTRLAEAPKIIDQDPTAPLPGSIPNGEARSHLQETTQPDEQEPRVSGSTRQEPQPPDVPSADPNNHAEEDTQGSFNRAIRREISDLMKQHGFRSSPRNGDLQIGDEQDSRSPSRVLTSMYIDETSHFVSDLASSSNHGSPSEQLLLDGMEVDDSAVLNPVEPGSPRFNGIPSSPPVTEWGDSVAILANAGVTSNHDEVSLRGGKENIGVTMRSSVSNHDTLFQSVDGPQDRCEPHPALPDDGPRFDTESGLVMEGEDTNGVGKEGAVSEGLSRRSSTSVLPQLKAEPVAQPLIEHPGITTTLSSESEFPRLTTIFARASQQQASKAVTEGETLTQAMSTKSPATSPNKAKIATPMSPQIPQGSQMVDLTLSSEHDESRANGEDSNDRGLPTGPGWVQKRGRGRPRKSASTAAPLGRPRGRSRKSSAL